MLGRDWTQRRLATAAGLGESTVRNFEKGRAVPSDESLQAIADALKAAGVVLVPSNGEGPGVRLKRPTASPSQGGAKKAAPKAKAKRKAK